MDLTRTPRIEALLPLACLAISIYSTAQADKLHDRVFKFSNGVQITHVSVKPIALAIDFKRRETEQGPNRDERTVVVSFDYRRMPAGFSAFEALRVRVGRIGSFDDETSGSGPDGEATYQFDVPAKWRTADLAIALAVGNFHPVASTRRILYANIGHNAQTAETPHELRVTYGTNLKRFFVGIPADAELKQYRIVGFDAADRPVNLKLEDYERPMDNMLGGPTAIVDCPSVPKSLAKLVLEVRENEWIKIPGVHLYPNAPPNP